MIAAMDRNRMIGRNNQLPWRLPADMAFFIRMTKGKTVVMGRKTFESLKKPLKDRTNVVLTRDASYAPDGCVVLHSIEEVRERFSGEGEVVVIGGEQIYTQFLPYADKLYLTRIDEAFEGGDAYFPSIDQEQWDLAHSEPGIQDENNPYSYQFQTYIRR